MKYFAFGLAAALAFSAQTAHAANYICRGANAALYAKAVQQTVGKQLTAANVPFRKVYVTIRATDRAATKASTSYDASKNVTVASDLSSVTFAGSFPAPSPCQLPGTMRIVVMNGNVAVLDQSVPVTLTGTLLLGGLGSGSSGSSTTNTTAK